MTFPALLAALSLQASAPEQWVVVAAGHSWSGAVDVSSLETSGDQRMVRFARVWERTTTDGVDYVVQSLEFNCSAGTVAVLSQDNFAGDGRRVGTEGPAAPSPYPDDADMAAVEAAVCRDEIDPLALANSFSDIEGLFAMMRFVLQILET